MEWKKKKLRPAIITHDCIRAEITFDRLFVVRSDHSLWMLYPFTSEMWLEFREKRGRNLSFTIPKFTKIMENVEQITASAMTIAAVKTDHSYGYGIIAERKALSLLSMLEHTDGCVR